MKAVAYSLQEAELIGLCASIYNNRSYTYALVQYGLLTSLLICRAPLRSRFLAAHMQTIPDLSRQHMRKILTQSQFAAAIKFYLRDPCL